MSEQQSDTRPRPKSKWSKGGSFKSPMAAITWIYEGGDVYFRHKWTSHGWARNWSIAQIRAWVEQNWLFTAIKEEDEP